MALSSHRWLPVAVTCHSGPTLGTGFGKLAKPGEGNEVRTPELIGKRVRVTVTMLWF